LLGVCKSTLLRWIRVGFIPEPPCVKIGQIKMRVWKKDDLTRALYHRRFYYYWTRKQIDEQAAREKWRAEMSERGTHNGEPGAAQG